MADALSISIGHRTAVVAFSAERDVRVDEVSLEIAYGPTRGEVVVRTGEHQTRAFVVRAAETTWVFHEGRTFVAAVEAEGASRQRTPHGPGSLMAPMPATVIAVNVRAGDAVKAGDVLILLEAMKMELPLRATDEAVVSAVHCSAGDLVQPNVSLVDLEAATTPNAQRPTADQT